MWKCIFMVLFDARINLLCSDCKLCFAINPLESSVFLSARGHWWHFSSQWWVSGFPVSTWTHHTSIGRITKRTAKQDTTNSVSLQPQIYCLISISLYWNKKVNESLFIHYTESAQWVGVNVRFGKPLLLKGSVPLILFFIPILSFHTCPHILQ